MLTINFIFTQMHKQLQEQLQAQKDYATSQKQIEEQFQVEKAELIKCIEESSSEICEAKLQLSRRCMELKDMERHLTEKEEQLKKW